MHILLLSAALAFVPVKKKYKIFDNIYANVLDKCLNMDYYELVKWNYDEITAYKV